GGAPVLPDDRFVDGLAALPVPDNGGLALVGDADGRDVGGRGGRLGERCFFRFDGGAPQIFGLMLDPARSREMLREFLLGDSGDGKVGPEQDGACRCRTLVERKYVGRHKNSPLTRGVSWGSPLRSTFACQLARYPGHMPALIAR